jgi:hypothetical protein
MERPAGAAHPARGTTRVIEWTLEGAVHARRVAVIVPEWRADDAPFRVLLALHGRGEAMRGPVAGALGWARDYALTRAIARVSQPPLRREDFEGFVTDARLAELNEALARDPFRGYVVVCPYLPDLDPRSHRDIERYARDLLDVVLPRVRESLPVDRSASATGIDGVSLGGAFALRIGLMHPEAFGSVAALQPAIQAFEADELKELAIAARTKRPELALRLVTSTRDYFRTGIHKLSAALSAAHVAHRMDDLPGPHDYAWNRGTGAIELLVWHDRALSGTAVR